MDEVKKLRAAENRIEIEGFLKDFNKWEQTDQYVRGNVIIAESPTEEHMVGVYIAKNKRDGTPNQAYEQMVRFVTQSKTLAQCFAQHNSVEGAYQNCTKVNVSGFGARLGVNEFYVNGELVSRQRAEGVRFREVSSSEFKPRATFWTECYIHSMKSETGVDGDATGKLLIDVYIPIYGEHVIPFRFTAKGDVAEYLRDNYSNACSAWLSGKIVNTIITRESEHRGFGAPTMETKRTVLREFEVTGGAEEPYERDSDKDFPVEAIRAAVVRRESEYLPSLLEKSKTRGDRGGSTPLAASATPGFAGFAGAGNKTSSVPDFDF